MRLSEKKILEKIYRHRESRELQKIDVLLRNMKRLATKIQNLL